VIRIAHADASAWSGSPMRLEECAL
jgi:hypothetical protein